MQAEFAARERMLIDENEKLKNKLSETLKKKDTLEAKYDMMVDEVIKINEVTYFKVQDLRTIIRRVYDEGELQVKKLKNRIVSDFDYSSISVSNFKKNKCKDFKIRFPISLVKPSIIIQFEIMIIATKIRRHIWKEEKPNFQNNEQFFCERSFIKTISDIVYNININQYFYFYG